MLHRREFLKIASLAALAPAACLTPRTRGTGAWVNDIHSQLNETYVAAVHAPQSLEELQALVRRTEGPICIAGGRHAMGGQQFASNATLLDMNAMNRVLAFDRERGIVDVEAGIQWPALIKHLVEAQRATAGPQGGIAQKQTGADRLSIGGALAANVHGRGLRMKPIVGDVESFTLVDASGRALECSRTQNRELFALAIGGYGLFGVIASVRLRLVPRRKVERVVDVLEIEQLVDAFDQRIREGFLYGDFQFSIDDRGDDFLRRGVFSCYRPVDDATPVKVGQAELAEEDWRKLLLLAHANKRRAYREYVDYYRATSGQVYWSDEHQLSIYPDDYHRALDPLLGAKTRGTEMISELYVPRERLADFMRAAQTAIRTRNASVIYGTVRLIERDDETFLPWAKQPYACVIFNLHTEHSPAGIEQSAEAFRALIDLALERGGSYFLTYHRWARRNQVEAAYPQFAEMLRRKRAADPRERFQSEWYRHYKAMFA